jgi:GNAT superfamily N-acetyltransferase
MVDRRTIRGEVSEAVHTIGPMPELDIILTDGPSDAERHAVGGGLSRFNDAVTGIADRRPLAVLVRTRRPDQGIIGGLIGRTSLGLLFITEMFLPESLRGGGIGRRIVTTAEDEARRRGCIASVLYTISFQAPGFYQRLGYSEFGRVECLPPGTARIFMRKDLRSSPQ